MFKNNKIGRFTYKCLVLLFYYLGDILCRVNFEWAGDLYHKSMKLSLYFDEKINFWFWNEPPLNKETDL